MSAVDDVRAKLRDRQVKAGARGTIEEWIPLDLEQLEELGALQTSLIDVQTRVLAEGQPKSAEEGEAPKGGRKRLSDPAPISLDVNDVLAADPEVVKLQEEVAAAEKAVRDGSLRLVFRSVGSLSYAAIVNRHADADDTPAGRAQFLNELATECLHEVWTADGELLEGLTWSDIYQPNGPDSEGPLNYGEWQRIVTGVRDLNQRVVDFPFSLRSSGRTRS